MDSVFFFAAIRTVRIFLDQHDAVENAALGKPQCSQVLFSNWDLKGSPVNEGDTGSGAVQDLLTVQAVCQVLREEMLVSGHLLSPRLWNLESL